VTVAMTTWATKKNTGEIHRISFFFFPISSSIFCPFKSVLKKEIEELKKY